MIISYFNNTKPINIVFLSIILSVLVFISYYINGNILISIQSLEKYVLIISTFFLFNFIIKDKIVSSKNQFSIFYYVIFSGLFYTSFLNLNIIISNIFIILALKQLFDLSHKDVETTKNLFNNGLLIGLAYLFYPITIIFILLSFVGIIIFNKISWKSFLIPIIGFIVPLIFVYVINDFFKLSLIKNNAPIIIFNNLLIYSSIIFKLILVFTTILLIWSITIIFLNINSELIFYKDYNVLIMLLLILSIIIFFYTSDISNTIFLILPISIIISNATTLIHRKWIINLILTVLIIFLILNYIF